jgi:uncharacterized membrane protein
MRLTETDRLEAFSDSVMAVIITIMAFEVKSPDGASWSAVHTVVPALLVYVLSFAFIGIYWNNHHHLLRTTERMNGSVMWSNLFLLFWLSMIPIVTSWVARFPDHSLPAATYGVVGFGAAVAYWILVRTIIRANSANAAIAQAVGNDVKGVLSLVLYVAGTGLAFLAPAAAYVLYGCVAVTWFVPDRRLSGMVPDGPSVGDPQIS